MSDLAERLRSFCTDWNGEPLPDGAEPMDGIHCDILREAATEIDSLRRENQELRQALEDILAPFAAAQRDLKPDERLNGDAYFILNSVANLRVIATNALTMSDIHREQLDRPRREAE